MDKERSQDLMTRGRSSARRFSPARRHPMRSSSIVIKDNNRSNGGDGERYGSVSRSLKKEKARISRWRSSNNGAEGMVGGTGSEGDPPLTTTNNNNDVSDRRRVRLREKVSEDGNAMDPASVPRRLRSAINKRSNQSASPPLPDTRKKRCHTSKEETPYVIDENKSEQNALTNSMTKEDEDVARILYGWANMIPISQLIRDEEDRKPSEDMPNINANNASHSKDSKEEDANNSRACVANEVTNPSTGLKEPIRETANAETSLEQSVIILESSTVEPEPNKAAKSDVPTTLLLSKIDHAESTSLMNAANSLRSSGASSQYYSGNGSLPPTQRDALSAPPMQKPDIAPWPFGSTRSATVKHEVQPDKQRTDTGANVAHREGTDPLVPSGLPTSTQAPLATLSTGKTAVWPGSAASTTGLNSSGNGPRTQKPPAMPLNVLWLRKRCATHVYLSNLIRHHQNMERKSSLPVPPNQSKSKDGSNLGVPAANETARLINGLSCMASAGTNGSLMERNAQEARLQMSNAGRLLRAQQASKLSEAYTPQKQNSDFLSLSSAGGETSYSGNGVKLSGQTHLSLVPQQAAHHSVMPFGYSHVPRLTPCTEKLSSAAAQQLQLPQYMGNPFYGPQMSHAGCPRPQHQPQQHQQHQQQPMWPNHLAHYKPPMGFPMWQNGRPQDLSRQLQLCAQASPAFSPSPAIEGHARAYPPLRPQHHQLQVNPSLPSSSSTKHHLSGLLNNGGYRPQVPSQLQLLCNAQRS